ncbi:MAG TPA: thiamine pyrophosphate-binding protein [Actinomycetes bacterium]
MSHAGDLLAELLVRYGVTHVFGQPGGQTAALYDGLARRSAHVRHALVRDERSAAYAADAFARLTGRPGVCDVTVGPGTTKLTDGLVESRNAAVPVVALVGELPRDWAPYREMGVASQGFDQLPLLAAITKAALAVPSLASLPQMVRTAFRVATSGRPGPVALVVPHDVLDAEWLPAGADLEVDDRYRRAPAYRPVASPDSVEQAAALLRKARRPLVVAGGGVHASRVTTELAALAERLDAVVVTSFSGKGAVDETAPYAAGVLNPLGTTASLELARRADVVLWCGCKVGQNTSHNWSLPLAHQATIQLDADPGELGRTFRPTVALNGDARATLAALLALLPGHARPRWREEAREEVEESARRRALDEGSDAVPILPQRVMRELAARLRPGDVVVSDASFSAGWVAAHLPARRAARDFLFARGQGGLGYAVPAAIGAAAARPDDRVVTVSGDGGFSYALGELATHAQLGMRSVNVVLNNGSLAWLAIWQQLFFEGLRQSVDLEDERLRPGYAGVAEALGCVGLRVERPGELGDALDAAFGADRPAVVEVRTDPSSTPVHGYRRRLAEPKAYPRPGTVYELPPWRRSPAEPTSEPE